MEIQLPATIDDYCNQLSPSRRKKIRYGLKRGLRAEWGSPEALPTFYKIFATNMRNLGTPVYPSGFFENQMRLLRDKIRILSMWDGAKPVAASLSLLIAMQLNSHGPRPFRSPEKKEAPMIMYWALIEKAIAEGFRKS